MDMGRPFPLKSPSNLFGMLAVNGHPLIITLQQAHRLAFKQVDRGENNHVNASVSQNAFSSLRPASPLFSGWN